MAAAGLFQMGPYQWTDTARLATENLKAASDTAARMDKKKPKAGGSGIGGMLGGVVGSIAGSFFGPAGTMIGGTLGGALGGAVDGGSAGAATGAAGGLGMGTGFAGSDSFMGGMDSMWGNLGLKGSSATGGFKATDMSVSSSNGSSSGSTGSSISDSMSLLYGPTSGFLTRGMF